MSYMSETARRIDELAPFLYELVYGTGSWADVDDEQRENYIADATEIVTGSHRHLMPGVERPEVGIETHAAVTVNMPPGLTSGDDIADALDALAGELRALPGGPLPTDTHIAIVGFGVNFTIERGN